MPWRLCLSLQATIFLAPGGGRSQPVAYRVFFACVRSFSKTPSEQLGLGSLGRRFKFSQHLVTGIPVIPACNLISSGSVAGVTFAVIRFNWSGSFTRFLQRHSYTVYVIQAPIIVFVVVALMVLSLEHLLKFGLAAVITVPLCFAAAYLVLKIPFASRVL